MNIDAWHCIQEALFCSAAIPKISGLFPGQEMFLFKQKLQKFVHLTNLTRKAEKLACDSQVTLFPNSCLIMYTWFCALGEREVCLSPFDKQWCGRKAEDVCMTGWPGSEN